MATVQNVIANELLCFISNKIKKMTYDMLLKLVMDFYSDDAVSQAKSILLDNVVIPEDDDKKRNRKGLNKKLNTMKDILNLFLVMTLEDLPLFVASDLSNLPPLSMDNFDMSSVVREMEIIKNQMRIMQDPTKHDVKDIIKTFEDYLQVLQTKTSRHQNVNNLEIICYLRFV